MISLQALGCGQNPFYAAAQRRIESEPEISVRNEPPPAGHPVSKLSDVARLAGVSTATVSRCLNTPEQVVARTREKVMTAVHELGYAPNFSARSLAAKRTNTIGAIIPTMENAIFARGIQAFQEELGRRGKTLLIASSSYQEALEAEQIRNLVARGADAILLIGYHRAPELYAFLERRAVPYLVAWSFDGEQTAAAIGFDNKTGMAALAQKVVNFGHRHIAVISAPVATNDRARDRVEGVRLAMRDAGLDAGGLRVVETPYGIDTGAQAFRDLMHEAPETTAVICGNDVLAIGAMRAARGMGLRVPADVSVTGFDDIELAALADPELTTVHVPHREMGRRAATMLIDMLNGAPAEERRVELPIDIRLRGSLGPVRSA